jgi:hypothetical protein
MKLIIRFINFVKSLISKKDKNVELSSRINRARKNDPFIYD